MKTGRSNRNRNSNRRPGRPATRESRGRDRGPHSDGEAWLCGLHAVREALRAGRRPARRLLLRAGRTDSQTSERNELIELARASGISVEEVDAEVLEQYVEEDANHQGVALQAGPLPELTLKELVERAGKAKGGRRILALDGVEDPHNVGAVARVAESAGVQGMILTERRSPPLTASVARASAGAIEWLPVARVTNLGRALAELQSEGYWVVAAALDGSGSLFEIEDRILSGDLVIVLGAEGQGLRPSILDLADHRVEIPMRGQIASLNVSTAGAVLLYDLLRRSEAIEAGADSSE